MKFDHQQVIIDVDGAHELSIVSIDGKSEVAICGPEGVFYNTVTPINNVRELISFLAHWFGGPEGL